MLTFIPYLVVALVAYLMGSFSTSYVVSRIKKVDLKKTATRNLGASNTTVVLGWKFGLLVGVVDIAKGIGAVLLTRFFAPDLPAIAYVAATSVTLGHIFPFYLKFRGGKGFATFIGSVAGLCFPFAVVLAVVIISLAFITNYLVVGTFITALSAPLFFYFWRDDLAGAIILAIASLVIILKHRENIVHIKDGTEGKVRNLFGKGHRKKTEEAIKELDRIREEEEAAKKAQENK